MALTRAEIVVSFRYFSVIFFIPTCIFMSDLFTDHRTQILKLTLGARGGQSGGLGGGEREQWDS